MRAGEYHGQCAWQLCPRTHSQYDPVFSLDMAAQVLMWSRGVYHFDTTAHMGTAVFLDNNEIFSVTDYYTGTGWDSFATVDLVPLAAGEHTLDLRTQAQQSGTMSYGSGCLEYIVLSGL